MSEEQELIELAREVYDRADEIVSVYIKIVREDGEWQEFCRSRTSSKDFDHDPR
jgi:hypothetical protein